MGKNVIVGQSGGPTSVINASLAGVFQAAKRLGAKTVYGMVHGVDGLLGKRVVDLGQVLKNDLDIELLKRTPSSFLGSCRCRLPDAAADDTPYRKLLDILQQLDIGYFFYIGGNDSMDTIAKLAAYGDATGSGIRFIGVPKTIDNDLVATDHTPGYGSAAKYIGVVLKELIRDSIIYNVKNVTLVEIMGRNAGWLTGAAALARGEDCEGADLIYLPEVPFDTEGFLSRIEALHKQKNSVVVAVSEGIRLADGRYVCEQADQALKVDAFGHKYLAGAARYLSSQVASRLGCKTRAVELSTLQRCAGHLISRTDAAEAFQAGSAAVQAAFDGKTGQMVALHRTGNHPYQCVTRLCPVKEVANLEKQVPRGWITPDGTYVTDEFIRYARPLIQEELAPIYVDGLPRHISLNL